MQFVSEKEVEEIKERKQKEWEKVRRPDQPLQRPEEEIDNRTLYEKLKSQKDKKQEDFEEQLKFKNMIYKGLDEDEAVFLQGLAENRAQIEAKERNKEKEELMAYREAVEKLKEEDTDSARTQPSTSGTSSSAVAVPKSSTSSSSSSSSSSLTPSAAPTKPQKSQLSIIAGSIKTKRRRSSVDDSETGVSPEKKAKIENIPKPPPAAASDSGPVSVPEVSSTTSSSVLTGLDAYSSSSSLSDTD